MSNPPAQPQPDETSIDRDLLLALVTTTQEDIEGWVPFHDEVTSVTGNRTDHFFVMQAPSGALWGYDYFTIPSGNSISDGPEQATLYAVIAEPMPRVRYRRRPITP